jgi:hypothetical protein
MMHAVVLEGLWGETSYPRTPLYPAAASKCSSSAWSLCTCVEAGEPQHAVRAVDTQVLWVTGGGGGAVPSSTGLSLLAHVYQQLLLWDISLQQTCCVARPCVPPAVVGPRVRAVFCLTVCCCASLSFCSL